MESASWVIHGCRLAKDSGAPSWSPASLCRLQTEQSIDEVEVSGLYNQRHGNDCAAHRAEKDEVASGCQQAPAG